MATPINKILSNQTQAFSQEELANISASLQEILGQGGGVTQSDYVFIPVFNEQTGDITFMLSTTGASGRGPWHISGPQGPSGASGAKGEDGVSPTVVTADIPVSEQFPAGGIEVTITDTNGDHSFNISNGRDGAGATVNLLGGDGIEVTKEGANYTIAVSANYSAAAVTSAKNWVNAQGYVSPPSTTLTDSYWFWNSNQEDAGWKALQIVISADGRLCSIGEGNAFVYKDGGLNDVLLQGYANSGTYEDFAQGYENSAFQYSLVQGRQNKARTQSLAQGYRNIASGNSFAQGNENTAEIYSLAQGYENSAVHHSLAQGYENTASNYSFAQGTTNIALSYSLSQGVGNRAETYSIAQGQGNRAFANSQAFGLSTIASGSSIDGHHYGMMSIGSYNATTAGALFVIGNGYSENSTDYRSDAFIVYKDGHVSAAGDIWANGVKLGAGGGGIVGPTGTGVEDKYWLYSTYTGNSWIEANTWLCNNFICENGISGVPDMSLGKVHIGLSGDYLPTSGGTVSGQLEIHGGSNFDQQFIKLTREGNSCGARIGLGSDTTNGTLALKTFNAQGQNTVQVNVKHSTNNNELIQVQKDGNEVGHLIPAKIHTGSYTPTSDDGILHIVLES